MADLPADPFDSGNARLDLLNEGGRLTSYLLEAPTEAEGVRRLRALGEDDLRCVVLHHVYPEWRDKEMGRRP
jgi:hypothetical protein